MQMQGDILSTLLEVADPVSLDTLVEDPSLVMDL